MNVTQTILENCPYRKHAPALHFKENNQWKSYSWEEFHDLIAQTANALKELGVVPGENVAIFADNMPQWIITDLAIISIGAVTVPIYATSTSEQAKYIIDEAQIKVALAGNQKQYDRLIELYAQETPLEHIIAAKKSVKLKSKFSHYFDDWIKDQSKELTIFPRENDDVASIIYTSGTTGEPKGAILTHQNFINVFDSHIRFFNFSPEKQKENSLAFLPLTHVFERCWTLFVLYCGWEVSISEDPKEIAQTLKEVKPTTMCSVPRFFQKIYIAVNEKIENSSIIARKMFRWSISVGSRVSELKRTGKKIPPFLAFRYLLAKKLAFKKVKEQVGGNLWFMPVGGASITPDITRFFDAIGIHLTVGYGLTETTATVTAFPFVNYKHGTAGQPMTGVQIKIGEDDEILVKGNGIFKGYYKKEEETRKAFTEDGWFKTGDAGVIDKEGNLVIVDRIKDLMKTSNGKYITPQLIENLLTNDNYIQQAVIIGDDKPYVTALLVPNFEALKTYAEEKLNLKFKSLEELINIQKIKDFYTERINAIQVHLAGFEQIKKFRLLPTDFSMELGEITPTLKVRRKIVFEKFNYLIEDMYIH
ncbi:MAG: long-chain fatty acid--CoA ligase [Flavobacteriaceae bacterium]|nr:long-chain fatty acid--CoA ligase [Flavobacteriaceae bacterium]